MSETLLPLAGRVAVVTGAAVRLGRAIALALAREGADMVVHYGRSRDEAERTVRAVLDSGYMDHHVAYALGAAQAQLGRPNDAVKWLREASETGFPCYPWLERDSLLDPIRSDPAFKALLTELRADYDTARTQYRAISRRP